MKERDGLKDGFVISMGGGGWSLVSFWRDRKASCK